MLNSRWAKITWEGDMEKLLLLGRMN
jgi:hypothetical protein